ncbi:MAG: AEC family transporter [Acholeplasmatales bacterium]|nr:AEC family transporter [Acholeplasmatales bacterium]
MEIFKITLMNVFITLLFILPGYLLGKTNKMKSQHLSSISQLLVVVCMPLMIISSFLGMGEFVAKDFGQMALFFTVSFILQCIFFAVLYLIVRRKFEEPRYRLFSIGSTLANVGFFGLPIVKAVLSSYPIVACFSCVYVCSMNVLVFTLGVFCITLDKKYISLKKALLNPASIGLYIALPLYIFNAYKYIPVELENGIAIFAKMTTPLCMIILGCRLSTMKLKNLFINKIVYVTILCKMIIFPIFCYFVVRFIPVLTYEFKAAILILAACPTASMVSNLAEIEHQEEELSSNIVLLTTLSTIITIPLVALLLKI